MTPAPPALLTFKPDQHDQLVPKVTALDLKKLRLLEGSVRAFGVRVPLIVTQPGPDGKRTILDGDHRYQLAVMLALPVAAVEYQGDPTPENLLMVQVTCNWIRVTRSPRELAELLEALRKAKGGSATPSWPG